ncbi:ankyrin repeat-containing domain protein [Xylariaceae sp. FL0662B]|nr:ankyrin repeat-containing domain protein [Xylariaceae sp. FL0662B]
MDHKQTQLSNIPNELLIQIVEYLDNSHDINSVTRVSRHFHWLFSDYFINLEYARCIGSAKPKFCLDLFLHALDLDSNNIIQCLTNQRHELDFRGFVPIRQFRDTTFLHLSLLGDAPRVAAHLIKFGADVNQEVTDYPDLTPLCLALARPKTSTQKEVDTSLRIACSYALPRTVASLLARGADPNALSPYGVGAMHSTVMKRLPWRYFKELSSLLLCKYNNFRSWETSIHTILSILLHFGAEINLPTQTSKIHVCDPTCWRLFDCDHRGQTALHLAAAGGLKDCVDLLFKNGAEHSIPNGDGYTPLYGALSQGNDDIIHTLLEQSSESNPIVEVHRRATALHIACRFAYSPIVHELLQLSTIVDVVDSQGRTPLHEVLGQTQLGRKQDVLTTLWHLADHRADPDITTSTPTPRQLAAIHPFLVVRDMFTLTKPYNSRLRSGNSSRKTTTQRGHWGSRSLDNTECSVREDSKSLISITPGQDTTMKPPSQPPSVAQFPKLQETSPSTVVQGDREDPLINLSQEHKGQRTRRETTQLNKEIQASAAGPKNIVTGPAAPEKGIDAVPSLIQGLGEAPSELSAGTTMESSSFWGSFARTARETGANNDETSRKGTRSDT